MTTKHEQFPSLQQTDLELISGTTFLQKIIMMIFVAALICVVEALAYLSLAYVLCMFGRCG